MVERVEIAVMDSTGVVEWVLVNWNSGRSLSGAYVGAWHEEITYAGSRSCADLTTVSVDMSAAAR